MARSAHVSGDSSVRSVGSPSTVLGSVYLDVSNYQFLQIKLLDVGVCFKVLQQVDDGFARLLGPPSLHHSELFGLASSSHGSIEPSIWNASFMGNNILQISDGLGDGHSFAGSGSFVGVFEVHSSVERSRLYALFSLWLV